MTEIKTITQIYREVGANDATLLEWLNRRDQLFEVTRDNGDVHRFVDNDIPRDSDITPLIIDNTVGFALFSEDGDYMASFETLAQAIRGQENARIVITTEVDIDSDD